MAIWGQDLTEISSTAMHPLGTVRVEGEGYAARVFVYAKAGASALAAGKLIQSPAPVANHLNKLVKAAAGIGSYKVIGAIGATALTADQYKDGFLHINDATGEGYAYRVKTHAAYSASATGCIFYLNDPIKVALVASTSEYTLTKHPCDGAILCPTTLTATVLGVPLVNVTANYYFWAQVKGPAAVLTAGSVVAGCGVIPDGTTAGAVAPEAATTTTVRVGTVMRVNASTDYSLINLHIPGF